MIHAYGNYNCTAAITSQHTNAAFVTPSSGANLFSGRTGAGQLCVWDTGTQSTATTVTITLTPTTAYESPAAWGFLGVFNIVGLPAGTKVVVNGVTQRLVAGVRGELNAMFLPQIKSATLTVTIFNDVNGAASIVSGTQFYIGQIYPGRAIALPMLLDGTQPSMTLNDPTAYNRASGLQLYQLMRKPYRSGVMQLGRFTVLQARGGASSTLANGDLSGGVCDVSFLRDQIVTKPVCAVCDIPSAGFGGNTSTVNGIKYDQSVMQNSWMLARPTDPGAITLDQPPYMVWNPSYQEAI
jgi:hypothetical protein